MTTGEKVLMIYLLGIVVFYLIILGYYLTSKYIFNDYEKPKMSERGEITEALVCMSAFSWLIVIFTIGCFFSWLFSYLKSKK